MSKWRNTNWAECVPEFPNEKWGPGNSSMQRKVRILDGSLQGRVQAAYDFLGYQVVIATGGVNYIHRVIPMPYPGLPAVAFQLAANNEPAGTLPPDITQKFFVKAISRTEHSGAPVGIDPLASPPGVGGSIYQETKLTLEGVTLPYAVIDDATLISQGGATKGLPDEGAALAKGWQYTRYITRRREAFNRVITIPYGLMCTNSPTFAENLKLNKTGIPFREGGEHRSYTWMEVPLTPPTGIIGAGLFVQGANWGLIESSLGMINNASFDGCDQETLLLDSIASREYQGSFGEWLADITFNMIFLPHASSGSRLANNPASNPRSPSGLPLKPGVMTGWNTVVDMDLNGNWDYYDVRSARVIAVGGANVILAGQKPYQSTDFSAFFRPA